MIVAAEYRRRRDSLPPASLLAVALLAIAGCATRQTVPLLPPAPPPMDIPDLDIQVENWPAGYRAALSLTFDDGTLDHYLIAAPLLEKHNLRGTFFLITRGRQTGFWNDDGNLRLLMTWAQARDLARRGHEIASHTHSHRDMWALEDQGHTITAIREMALAAETLDREIGTYADGVMAWPYWRQGPKVREAASRRYRGSRGGGADPEWYGSLDVQDTADPVLANVPSFAPLPNQDIEIWKKVTEKTVENGGWVVVDLHGIDNGVLPAITTGWAALPVKLVDDSFAWIKGIDGLWRAPFGEVIDFITYRKSFEWSVTAEDGVLSIDIQAPASDPGARPVYFSFIPPSDWGRVDVSVDGRPGVATYRNGRFRVLVSPGGGVVTLAPSSVPRSAYLAYARR